RTQPVADGPHGFDPAVDPRACRHLVVPEPGQPGLLGVDLLVEQAGREVAGQQVLVDPDEGVDPGIGIAGHHAVRSKRNSVRALPSTILCTSSSGTFAICSATTLRLLGQLESECG